MVNFFRRNNSDKTEPSKNAGKMHWERGKGLLDFDKLEALNEFDRAVDYNYLEAYVDRGWVLHALKYYYDAIQDFNVAISHESNDPNLYFLRSLSFNMLGCITIAIEDARIAVEYSKTPSEMNRRYLEGAIAMGRESHTAIYLEHYNYLLEEQNQISSHPNLAFAFFKTRQTSVERRPDKI